MNDVHYMAKTYEWGTPQALFDRLNVRFHFTLDVCATAENAKCERFFSLADDGLKQEWTGVCWMNPPYGKVIADWLKKAVESMERGATVVCLLPARTDASWWHDYVMRGDIEFLRGRVKFEGAKHNAPFPNAVVVFKP